jgi:glutathione S-transferase
MTIEISAYRWVPPFAQGYVKDLRVRWALEEAGLPYRAVLIDVANKPDNYPSWQPFGQVPAYRDGTVELFESGAIVLHIAAGSEALAPANAAGQARVAAWVIAALNSVEPFARYYLDARDTEGELARRPQVEALLVKRLEALAAALGDKEYLETRFTAGDLILTTVLRELVESGLLGRFPSLDAHRRRCEARPAFGRALEAQLQTFRENAPA